MSSTFEMNGTVVYQGRPGHASKSGESWCYSLVFLVNTSEPICDMTISTEDRGAALLPGAISLNPDMNPEAPDDDDREDGVREGIRIRRGKHSETGKFEPDAEQPHKRTDGNATLREQNRDWGHDDTEQGPYQPGGWRRTKIDGDLPDPNEGTDEIHIEFDPCLEPGKSFRITLCFDEQLDENDFIHFTPSNAEGAAIAGGDITPSETLQIGDIIRILGSLAAAGASKLMGAQKTPNKRKRQELASLIARDRKLLRMVRELAPRSSSVSIADFLNEHGVAAVLKVVGTERVIRTLGTKKLAEHLKELGLADEVKEALEE